MTPLPDFGLSFEALWSYEPFPWQRMLAGRLAEGTWPRALDLPTAAGKTACVDVAIHALAAQADRPAWKRTAPRRIWFVVDRRIVVDEAFERALRIAGRLEEATGGPLKEVAGRLRLLSGTDRPLAVARLRGGVLQDDGWARIPSQPAVITSTVDQLGSRLLFRGYGRSRLAAPIFAGLAAHDSLILLDEAHCSVPFLQTLQAVERFRGERWAETPIRTPFACVILSATPPSTIPATAELRPNDLVVVPAAYGMIPSGQSEPSEAGGSERLDLWEPARLSCERPAALRLHRKVLQPWLGCPPLAELVALASDPAPERHALWDAVIAVLDYQPATDTGPAPPPSWVLDLLRTVRQGRVETHPGGGLVLFSRDPGQRELEPDSFADDDDLLSAAGREVPLDVHVGLVRRAVERLARRCVDEPFHAPLVAAAEWHDAGKLDERFQLLLRQGDELAAVDGEPLAKSAQIPSSPARWRQLQEAAGLPREFRHEMVSLQLAERFAPLPEAGGDLALHLVASHHGHARPLAPVCLDPTPPALGGALAGVEVEFDEPARTSLPAPHALSSGITERYGRLTRRYGWWGLAYLEAVLRLGDWYGSRFSISAGDGDEPVNRRRPGVPAAAARAMPAPLVLGGVDGTNPLGFLTALGTLVALNAAGHCGARLGWRRTATWRPVITGLGDDMSTGDLERRQEKLAEVVAGALRGRDVGQNAEETLAVAQERYRRALSAVKSRMDEVKRRRLKGKARRDAIEEEVGPLEADADQRRRERQDALREAVPRPETAIGDYVDCTVEEYREHVRGILEAASAADRDPLDMLANFASDGCLHPNRDKARKGTLAPTPFCFTLGASHQCFLADVRQLAARVAADRVPTTLFEQWEYRDEKYSLRWDPLEDRRYALMDHDPSDTAARTVWMANLLAYRALALFPSAPRGSELVTAGWRMDGTEGELSWPIWEQSIGIGAVGFLLSLPGLVDDPPDHAALRARGVDAVLRARRIRVPPTGSSYKLSFSQAVMV